MAESTRHEAQPLDPNSRDRFNAPEEPFTFSPRQRNRHFNPRVPQTVSALEYIEGLEKGFLRSGRGLASLSELILHEENPVHRLKSISSGLVDNCLAFLNAHPDTSPSILRLLDAPAKSTRDTKNVLEIDFDKYYHIFPPLVFLIPACPNSSRIIGSTDPLLSSFLAMGIFVLQYRRRLKLVLDRIASFYRPVVSGAKSSPSNNVRYLRQPHWKVAPRLLAFLHIAPVIAVAWAPVRALRIASGVTASSSAAAVIPLRTIDGVPSWAWISDYMVWMICFTAYLTLQIHHIPRHRDHRRQLYLFLVILLAIHFAIALAQSSPTLIDGFTIFGPMVLTVTTFLVALLFGAITAMGPRGEGSGPEENATDTSSRPVGVGLTALSMCV